MAKKPSLDDEYEEAVENAASGRMAVKKTENQPVGKTIFQILCFAYPVLGLALMVLGYSTLQSANIYDTVDKSKFMSAIILGLVLILLPFVLWIHFKLIRWLLGIDEIIAELAKLRSKEQD